MVLFSGNASAADSGPVHYTGDAELAASPLVTGSGSEVDPYVFDSHEFNCSGSSYGLWIQDTTSYVVVNNCVFLACDGSTTDVYGYALYLQNAPNVTVVSNTFQDCKYGIVIRESENCVLDTNTINSPDDFGIAIFSSVSVEMIGNSISAGASSATYGIIATDSQYLTIDDNLMLGMGGGISLSGCDHLLVQADDVYGASNEYGISVTDCNDVEIVQCVIEDTFKSGVYCDSSNNVTVYNTYIENAATYGFQSSNTGNVSFHDNSVFDCFGAAYVSNCDELLVEGNILAQSTGYYGLWLSSVSGRIAGNSFYDLFSMIGSYYGIYIYGSHEVELIGNDVLHSHAYGIYAGLSNNLSIEDNVVASDTNTTPAGIFLDELTDSLVDGNTVSGDYFYGLSLNGCDNVTVSSNQINIEGLNGIDVNMCTDAGVGIAGNIVTGVMEYGLYASESYPIRVTGNVLNGSTNGIYMRYCHVALIEGNDCDGSGESGIRFEYGQSTPDIRIVNNSCQDCGSNGIYVIQSQNAVLEGNDCNASSTGISLYFSPSYVGNCTADQCIVGLLMSSSHGTIVQGGSFSHCQGGISIYDSNGVLVNGTYASNNTNNGINLANSGSGSVTGSSFNGNNCGVYVSQDGTQSITVIGCMVENNTECGLIGYGGFLTNVKGNHFANNLGYGVKLDSSTELWIVINNTFLNNNGVVGLDLDHYQCYDFGNDNRWFFNDGERIVGNGWSHMPNLDMDEDGYIDNYVYIYDSGFFNYQMPYGPKIEGPSAPTDLSYELTPYHIHLNWTAPTSFGNSTLDGYYIYMGYAPDLSDKWMVGQTSGALECDVSINLRNGETYYFGVLGYNEYGMNGDLSNIVEVVYEPYPEAPNGPIEILSDAEFAEAKVTYGWEGDGSAGNPYIIEDLIIDGWPGLFCLRIWNTDSYFVVRNCTFYMGMSNYQTEAVDLQVVNNGKFERCSFLGDVEYGLRLSEGQIDTIECLFDGPMSYGICASESDLLVSDCAFDSQFIGLYATNSYDLETEGSIFRNCSRSIVVMESGHLVVRGNQFWGGNAVDITNSYAHPDECLVEDNVGVGVYEFFRSSQLSGAIVRDNIANGTLMSYGAYFDRGSTVLVENNTFSQFHLGISSYATMEIAIRNNTLFANNNGIHLETVNVAEVSGNIIRDSVQYGMGLSGNMQDVLVTRNSFIDNELFAIYWGGGQTYATIFLNYFQGNNQNDGTWTIDTFQADNMGGTLTWELDGLGNHWADWTAPDVNGDGIVDHPYPGNEYDIDPFPLVNPFGAPTGLDAAVGPDHVNLTWGELDYDFSEGADGYRIYRGTSPDALVILDSSVVRWYNDTSVILGTTYYYRVSAFVGAEEGVQSDMISATPCDVPGALTGLTVEGQLRALQLEWTAPVDNGGSSVLGYVIWRGTSPGELVQYDMVGTVTSYTDLLVGDDETYYYAVTAFNQAGNGSASAIVGNTTFGFASAPLNVTTQFGNGNVTVFWSAPTDDGGTPITGYVIEYGIYPEFDFVSTGPDNRSFLITGLINGMEYSFRVLADNVVPNGYYDIGVVWSLPVYDTPATVPGIPEDVVSAAGAGTVGLSWLPPDDDGGAAPTSYAIYRMEIDGAWELIGTSSELVYEDQTVSDGLVYFYRVSAVNKAGEGDVSPIVRAVPGLPSAPVNLVAANSLGKVQLNWTAPADDGGSAILGYKVYRDGGSGFVYLALLEAASLGHLDPTATPGVEYRYRISAVTANGEGPSSNEAMITLPLVSPEAPVIDSAVQGHDGVLLAWHVPESSTLPDEFLLYRGTTAGSLFLIAIIDGAAFEYLDIPGTAGTFYALRSSNQYGVGEMSEVFQSTLGIVLPPEAPVGSEAIAGDSLVSLSWTASDGAVGYHIYRDNGSGFVSLATVAETEFADGTVLNGVPYSYRMTAFNDGGESGNSTTVLATPGTVPGTVANLTLTEGEAVVTLNWDAPADDGGSAVQSYRVYRDLNGTATMLAMVNSLTFTDHYVVSGLPHTYWIVALNAWGAGPESVRVNVTPDEIVVDGLPAPSYLLATVGNGMVTLTWDPMTSHGVDGFVVYRSDGGNFSFLAVRSSPTYTDNGLTNGLTYTYRVHCFVGISNGENASVEATPGTVPGAVTLSGQVTVDRILLSWSVPENGGSSIIGYRLYRTPGTGATVLLASLIGTTYVDTVVLAGVNYTYMVTALNAFGEGAPSNTQVLRTIQQVSPATDVPAEPYLSSVTGGNVSISLLWNVPSDTGDGAITGYNVYRGTSPLAAQLLVSVPAGTTIYADGTAVFGTTYYYWVSALNQWGESELSRLLSASLVVLAVPGEVDVDVAEGQGRMTLSWSVPDEGSSAITGYKIYRRGETGDRALIATVPAGTDTFVDGSVEAGVEYDYWVTAANAAGEGPLPDSPVSGMPLAVITGTAPPGPLPMIAVALGVVGLLVAGVAIVLVFRKK